MFKVVIFTILKLRIFSTQSFKLIRLIFFFNSESKLSINQHLFVELISHSWYLEECKNNDHCDLTTVYVQVGGNKTNTLDKTEHIWFHIKLFSKNYQFWRNKEKNTMVNIGWERRFPRGNERCDHHDFSLEQGRRDLSISSQVVVCTPQGYMLGCSQVHKK